MCALVTLQSVPNRAICQEEVPLADTPRAVSRALEALLRCTEFSAMQPRKQKK